MEVKARSQNEMKKTLNWWDLMWFGIGVVIGAGIFVLTGLEARGFALRLMLHRIRRGDPRSRYVPKHNYIFFLILTLEMEIFSDFCSSSSVTPNSDFFFFLIRHGDPQISVSLWFFIRFLFDLVWLEIT
jgi:hypothetical protein